MGADAVLDAGDPAWHENLKVLHDGRGPDLVIEAAGTVRSAEQSVMAPRRGGRTVIVGLAPGAATVDLAKLALDERRILGSLSHVWNEEFAQAVSLLAEGLIRADEVVAARIPLTETVTVGFECPADLNLRGAKVLVGPHLSPASP